MAEVVVIAVLKVLNLMYIYICGAQAPSRYGRSPSLSYPYLCDRDDSFFLYVVVSLFIAALYT